MVSELTVTKGATRGVAPPLPPLKEGGRLSGEGGRPLGEEGRPHAEAGAVDDERSLYADTAHSDRARVRIGSAESKGRIARAAASLFADKGIDGTTTREIAEAAGCSEGLIYRYWPSKEALAAHLFHLVHERFTRMVRDTIASGSNLVYQVDALVMGYCALADADWDLFRFHLLTTHFFLPTPEGEDNPVTAAEEIVRRAMANDEIADGDPVLVAAMALGVLTQTALHKVYGRFEGALTPYARELKFAVMGVLQSGEVLAEARGRR